MHIMARYAIAGAALLLAGCVQTAEIANLPALASLPLDDKATVTRITFGSCARPGRDQSIYDAILARDPDVFLFLGDNVYGPNNPDPSLKGLRRQYQLLGDSAPFARLRERVPVLVTWDDHDFGPNDAGGDFPHKTTSQQIFKHVWGVQGDDPRAGRDGVYHARTVGPVGQRVQFILLDTRYFRSSLAESPKGSRLRYQAQTDPAADMLGEAQWRWLGARLREPADLRILATSIQLLADGHGFEAWRTMPVQRERLFRLIRDTRAKNVITISGDRHLAAMYRRDDVVGYPLFEVTSSSLNVPLASFVKNVVTEPGPHRLHEPVFEANFAEMEVDWARGLVRLTIRSDAGEVLREQQVLLSGIR